MMKEDNRNLLLAIVMSVVVLLGWQFFYGVPQMEKQKQIAQQNQQAQSQGAQFLVTVSVSPEEAVRLVHGINAPYTLYAGLLGDNTTVNPGLSTDDRGYFGGSQP